MTCNVFTQTNLQTFINDSNNCMKGEKNVMIHEITGLFHSAMLENHNDRNGCYLSKVSDIEEIKGFK